MMRCVGYVSGNTLVQIQDQWGTLLEADVDVILFDRHFLKLHFDQPVPAEHAAVAEAMWRYIEVMRVGQDITGNHDNYQELADLQPGDTIVLTQLDTLKFAEPDVWDKIYSLCSQGVRLAVLSNGFHSAGQFGDDVLAMLNTTFGLGRYTAGLDHDDAECSEQEPESEQVIAAVHAFLCDRNQKRCKITACHEIPEGWYRTFDPSDWRIFSIVDSTENRIGATHYVAVNPETLEVRDLGRIGE